jgi:DNA-binding response OmpR family regulator
MTAQPVTAEKPWILVVDDNVLFASALEAGFMDDFQVIVAHKFTDALVKLRNRRFNCILLDLKLSNADGGDIVTRLKSEKRTPNSDTPIIIISGFVDPDVVAKLRNSVAGIFVKPFQIETLRKKVIELIKRPTLP